MTTSDLIRSEVIESSCCNAPSTSLCGPHIKVDNDQRRCIRCKQLFFVEVYYDDPAAAVVIHRIRMSASRWRHA